MEVKKNLRSIFFTSQNLAISTITLGAESEGVVGITVIYNYIYFLINWRNFLILILTIS